MIILTIRTDNPQSELGIYDGPKQLCYVTWQAHRQLAETIHIKMAELLKQQNLSLADVNGIVAYEGPGSFTGLRIGLSVANAIAYGLGVPVVAKTGLWIEDGIADLLAGNGSKYSLPNYGQDPHITVAKK